MIFLPRHRYLLQKLTRAERISAILDRWTAIHYDCSQRGDDRCHFDKFGFMLVLGLLRMPDKLPSEDEMMLLCALFYENCRTEAADPSVDHPLNDPTLWPAHLAEMSDEQLLDKLVEIQWTVYGFGVKATPHNVEDYRKVYSLLPGEPRIDFRLPSREAFLGRAVACAGCPNFIDSHGQCDPGIPCNLHQLGPCDNSG